MWLLGSRGLWQVLKSEHIQLVSKRCLRSKQDTDLSEVRGRGRLTRREHEPPRKGQNVT